MLRARVEVALSDQKVYLKKLREDVDVCIDVVGKKVEEVNELLKLKDWVNEKVAGMLLVIFIILLIEGEKNSKEYTSLEVTSMSQQLTQTIKDEINDNNSGYLKEQLDRIDQTIDQKFASHDSELAEKRRELREFISTVKSEITEEIQKVIDKNSQELSAATNINHQNISDLNQKIQGLSDK